MLIFASRSVQRAVVFITVTSFCCLSGCAKDPSKDAPAARVGKVKPTAAPAKAEKPASPSSEKPQKNPSAEVPKATKAAAKARASVKLSGTVGFVGSKVTGSHTGVFKTWTGSMQMDPDGGNLALEFSADVASVVSDPDNRGPFSEKLDGHLKSPDFFDAGKFPRATFKSTAVVKAAKAGASHSVTGELTMRGVTRPVTFPATIQVKPESVTASAEFTIQRSQWGIVYKGKANDLIRDGVVMKVQVNGKR